MSIADAEQRQAALDPLRSFCVSAPAGSGKTELLIQRYLRLLARVESPEQVLAITFTRKAAAEMRQRIIEALLAAQAGEPCGGSHQQITRDLALEVLAADKRSAWQLTRDVHRINIKTIDSFCGVLTRQMPILSEFGGQANIVDNAEELHREAVRELFASIQRDTPLGRDFESILLHFDNDWQKMQDLLVSMLQRRDQWREYAGLRLDPEMAESLLLRSLRSLVNDQLHSLAERFEPHRSALVDLQQYAAANLGTQALEAFPDSCAEDLPHWRRLSELLLTREGRWRKTVDKRSGFPASGESAKAYKQAFLDLVAQFRDYPELEESLLELRKLPEIKSDERPWQLVLQLFHILPQLAAHLLLVFARHGQVDHAQVALSAIQALGEDDLPTELALRLDYRIEHILVDEFQDTAISQFELVRRLTRGWASYNQSNPGAPRTVMIVGDGMQSIYGFRDANVGLFLKAREEGFNGVLPEHLRLSCNFRSDQGVVEWTNDTFVQAFPVVDDMRRGRVKFTPAVPVKPRAQELAVECHGFIGEAARAQEVEFICHQVSKALAIDECRSIAVLGRSRSHLEPIIQAFRRRDIDYSAQELDTLGHSVAAMDLMSLCRALANPADRVAWLALLRAPWCGLELGDLHHVANWGEREVQPTLRRTLSEPDLHELLSPDGSDRLNHLRAAIARAEALRDRLALRVWVEELWLDLGGAATLAGVAQMDDAERFFQLLEQADRDGIGLNIQWLQHQLDRLKVSHENPDAKVQVMTLHKAKGLEFDWVLIPGLGRTTRGDRRQLLLWDDYTTGSGERGFLLAADDRSREGEATLYNFLQYRRKQKSREELTRLLYVGATRAVQHLVLSTQLSEGTVEGDWRAPPVNSLLAPIWDTFRGQMTVHEEISITENSNDVQQGQLRRLAILPEIRPESAASASAGRNVPDRDINRIERHVGTVVHEVLEHLSLIGELPTGSSYSDITHWNTSLRRLGLSGDELLRASAMVEHSVLTTLQDDTGRWILSAAHGRANSEYKLTYAVSETQTIDLIIDRTFVDDATGERWIVDYKTACPREGEPMDKFLAREQDAYREQLRVYCLAMRSAADEPIRCALYFTAIAHLQELTIEGVTA